MSRSPTNGSAPGNPLPATHAHRSLAKVCEASTEAVPQGSAFRVCWRLDPKYLGQYDLLTDDCRNRTFGSHTVCERSHRTAKCRHWCISTRYRRFYVDSTRVEQGRMAIIRVDNVKSLILVFLVDIPLGIRRTSTMSRRYTAFQRQLLPCSKL